jgi:hypothetical protein
MILTEYVPENRFQIKFKRRFFIHISFCKCIYTKTAANVGVVGLMRICGLIVRVRTEALRRAHLPSKGVLPDVRLQYVRVVTRKRNAVSLIGM